MEKSCKTMEKIVGLTFMTADLFHVGHLNLLERASNYCDEIYVGIPSSYTIKEHIKGKEPIISSEDRLRIVNSCKYVNFSFVYVDNKSIDKAINIIKPNIIFRGDDWHDFPGSKEAKKLKIKIIYLPYTKNVSSTEIKRKICKNLK